MENSDVSILITTPWRQNTTIEMEEYTFCQAWWLVTQKVVRIMFDT